MIPYSRHNSKAASRTFLCRQTYFKCIVNYALKSTSNISFIPLQLYLLF